MVPETPRRLPPTVHHVVDARNWPSVQRRGLLPAMSLALSGLATEDARRLMRSWRPGPHVLADGTVLRDQRPMPEHALDTCLTNGLTPADWYELVNLGVYFWLSQDRLERHLAAQRGSQVVLELDGPALADAYAPRAFVTPFNVGAALRRPARRGTGTFVSYAAWLRDAWAAEAAAPAPRRRDGHPPAELVIRCDIPDALRFARRATEWRRAA